MSGVGQYELRYVQGTFVYVRPCWGLLLSSHRSWRGISCFLRMYMSFPRKSAFLIWFIQVFSSSEHMRSGTRIETCSQPYYPSFSWVPHSLTTPRLAINASARLFSQHPSSLTSPLPFPQNVLALILPPVFHGHWKLLFTLTDATSAIPGITGCYNSSTSFQLFIQFLLLSVFQLGG